MRDALRIFPSLNRPRLILGMDPTLFLSLTLLILLLCFGFQMHRGPVFLGLGLGAVGYPALLRLAKDDPELWEIYVDSLSTSGYFPARPLLEGRRLAPPRSRRWT